MKAVLPIQDDEDLWDGHAMREVSAYLCSIPLLTAEERDEVRMRAMGQAENKEWYQERQRRMMASNLKINLCDARSPTTLFDRFCIQDGVQHRKLWFVEGYMNTASAYAKLKLYNVQAEVATTALHIHQHYPFLAASSDRIVLENGVEGLLEVECSLSKVGMTPEEAYLDKNFFCELRDVAVCLKRNHGYFFQVQGQMAVTGHQWCGFVVWTNNTGYTNTTNVERIPFDRSFWDTQLLPGLLHFARHALVPELLTRRIRRLGCLYTKGQYVPDKFFNKGFYVVKHTEGLKVTLKRLKDV